MANFVLTARTTRPIGDGGYIRKGDEICISIPKFGVNAVNLRTRDDLLPMLRLQLAAKGIYVKSDKEIRNLFLAFNIKEV